MDSGSLFGITWFCERTVNNATTVAFWKNYEIPSKVFLSPHFAIMRQFIFDQKFFYVIEYQLTTKILLPKKIFFRLVFREIVRDVYIHFLRMFVLSYSRCFIASNLHCRLPDILSDGKRIIVNTHPKYKKFFSDIQTTLIPQQEVKNFVLSLFPSVL